MRLDWAPTSAPASEAPAWEDITDLLYEWEWSYGRNDETGEFEPGRGAVVLDNRDRLFDPTYSGEDTTNLVTNGGFETNTTGWSENDPTGGLTGVRSTEDSKFGAASLKLVAASSHDHFYEFVVAVSGSTTYSLSAFVNCAAFTAGATGNRGLYYEPVGGGGGDFTTLTGTTEGWVLHSKTFTTAATATSLKIRLYAPHGTVYWDGVQLEASSSVHRYVETDGATRSRSSANIKPRRKFRLQATWNGTTYPIFYAHARAYPQEYPSETNKRVRVDLADALAILKAVDLQAIGFNRPEERSDKRLNALLDSANIPVAERDIGTGTFEVPDTDDAAELGSAQNHAEQIGTSEADPIYVARTGQFKVFAV